jgi:nucleoside-diphosphate-sugar epimerase
MKVVSPLSLFVALVAVAWSLMPVASSNVCKSDLGPSTIAIFGGSGQTGRECVYQALKANHKVVVLARDPSKIKIPPGSGGALADQPLIDKNLHIVQGDVTDPATVDAVFDKHKDITGVIVALGGRTKDVGPTMLSRGTQNIVNAMKAKSKAKRISVLTVIGTGDSAGQAPLKFKILMHTVMRSIFADKNRQEKIFLDPAGSGHDLEYVTFRT